MSDIIDINVAQTVEEVTINVVDNVIQVNINQVNGGGGVPYTGATSDVDLGEFGLLTGNVEFDNTPTNIPTAAGGAYWNDSDGTLDLILKGGNVKLQVGQEQVIRVVNKTATNIDLLESNYQAVRVTGAQGQRLKVDLAQATTGNLSAETIGLVTETINNNQEGFITTSGLVRNINTTGSLQGETWADGDILYLSPTTAGRITKVKPVAPNHLVIIGYVVSAHATQGSIFVKVDNGYELDELHNVKIDTPLNNQGLIYNSTLQVWENKKIDLQSVLNEGSTADNSITLQGASAFFKLADADENKILEYNPISGNLDIAYPLTSWQLSEDKITREQNSFQTDLTFTNPTANRVITFKDESGTVALTSDIPAPITIDATPTDGSSNAVSSNGVFDALALKQDKVTGVSDTEIGYLDGVTSAIQTQFNNKLTKWKSGADGSTVANTVTITPTYSQLIPANTMVVGDVVSLDFRAMWTSAKTTSTNIYIYINTSNSLSGATQLGIFATGATNRFAQMNRKLSVKGSTTRHFPPTVSLPTDAGSTTTGNFSISTIDWTVDQYIIFAIGHTASDQSMFGEFYLISK